MPPISNLQGDYLVTLAVEGQPGIIVVTFIKGCADEIFGVKLETFNKLKQSL
jgi:hypothetical protein